MKQTWTLPFAPQSVRRARCELSLLLTDRGVTPARIDDAKLVVSELIANSLRHARPLRDDSLVLEVAVGATQIRLSVLDGGSTSVPAVRHPPATATGGRGLSIVNRLTRTWGVVEGADGNRVYGVLTR